MDGRTDASMVNEWPNGYMKYGFTTFKELHIDEINQMLKEYPDVCLHSLSTDIVDPSCNAAYGPWPYQSTSKVIIQYYFNNEADNLKEIRLDTLRERGFPRLTKKYKYYSFLRLKREIKKTWSHVE